MKPTALLTVSCLCGSDYHDIVGLSNQNLTASYGVILEKLKGTR